MSTTIIKPERDRDFYTAWSSIVEAPVAFGPRWFMAGYLRSETAPGGSDPARLDRAAEHGTSALWLSAGGRYLGWADEAGPIYQQQGFLPRRNMVAACERLAEDEHADVSDLLQPFDDEPARRST